MKNRKPTICVDLDGTILEYTTWKGEDHFGDPLPLAAERLGQLRDRGWIIIIHTTRGNENGVFEHLRKHGIPFDYINRNPDQPENANQGKPIADLYIDDRALHFDGCWDRAYVRAISRVEGFEEGA